MKLHKKYRTESNRNGERNDCVVITSAIAMNQPYGRVLERFYSEGRRRRCGSWPGEAFRVINGMGYWLEEIKTSAKTVGKLQLGKGRYIVDTRSHWHAVVDGVVEDVWIRGRPRSRVLHVWRVRRRGALVPVSPVEVVI